MNKVEPGLWSRRSRANVRLAQAYHERHFRDWDDWQRPLPLPPAGLVISAVSTGKLDIYAVGQRVASSLSALRRVVVAAGASGALKQVTQQYHSVDRLEDEQSDGASRLADVCLSAAERHTVAEATASFVSKYGPLIRDFGGWCADTDCGGVAAGRWLYPRGSPLPRVGNERFLWPPPWRRWAMAVYARAAQLGRVLPVPPPLGFYVWAALMLTALRDHPEWPGSRLFLANRLAAMRLVVGEGRGPVEDDERKGRVPVWAMGELLDYLAVSCAFGWSMSQVHSVTCGICGTLFQTPDARRRYCDPCRGRPRFRQTIAAMHSQRYRHG